MVMGMSGSSVTVAVGYTRTAQMIVLLIVMEKKDFVTIALKSIHFSRVVILSVLYIANVCTSLWSY